MSQENLDIIRGLYDSFARGGIPAVLGSLDADVEWREAEGFLYADQNPSAAGAFLGSRNIASHLPPHEPGPLDSLSVTTIARPINLTEDICQLD